MTAAVTQEALRVVNICNACRYCEGHCAVFPAITRQLSFTNDDMERLAHLCHQCGACYQHCQYAAPHPFNVNVPASLGDVRQQSYAARLRPAWLGNAFRQGSRFSVISTVICIALLLAACLLYGGPGELLVPTGNFYNVLPHGPMATIFSSAAIAVLTAWILTAIGYWRALSLPSPLELHKGSFHQAFINAATLKYLDGGHGDGCYQTGERPSAWRRRWHHLTVTGFGLCFLATCTGTFYHYLLALPAPYGFVSLPKLFGMTGGVLLGIGTAGLLLQRLKMEPAIRVADAGSGVSLTSLLLLTSLTGLALPFIETGKGLLLAVHLGLVLALFINFACGHFIHWLFRLLTLLADSHQKLGSE